MSYTIQKMRAKLHNGTVTQANLNYEGSITIGWDLLQYSGIEVGERVQVLNISNGNRIETYVIKGGIERQICINGAAAHLFDLGDRVIIIAYATVKRGGWLKHKEPKTVKVILNANNSVKDIITN